MADRGLKGQKRLAALGHLRPADIISLSAGAAELVGADALRGHLAEEVDGHGRVDRDHVFVLGDVGWVVHHGEGTEVHFLVVVQKFIQGLRAEGEAHHGPVGDELRPAVVDDALLHQDHEGVGHHFRVAAQVVFCPQAVGHGVGDAADADLQTSPVRNLVQNILGHGRRFRVGLHDAAGDRLFLHIRPDKVLGGGEGNEGIQPRHIGGEAIDLKHHRRRFFDDIGVHTAAGGAQADEAVFVGERDIQKRDIRQKRFVTPGVHLTQVDGSEVGPPCFQRPALLIAHEVGRDVEGIRVGAVQKRHGRDDVGAADGHVLQLLRAGGQGIGDGTGIAGAAADINFLPACYQGRSLRGGQFRGHLCRHGLSPPPSARRCPAGPACPGKTG